MDAVMKTINDLLCNQVLVCSVVSYFAAQILKIFTTLYKEKVLDFRLIFSSGGMPSSHSSTVCALAFSIARVYGVGNPLFAICVVLSGVVMYDATGVRREAGKHAKMLNQIVGDLFSGNSEYAQSALKELIGHTPLQVMCGAITGIAVALLVRLIPVFAG